MFGWFREKNRTPLREPEGEPGPVHQPSRGNALSPVEPPRKRCPLNAPGPFYTTGLCLACEALETQAPDLLAPLTGGNSTTYFARQPGTPSEVERACRAIRVCCVNDLRYGGTDRTIIERLGNEPAVCDQVIRDGQVVLSDRAIA